jgi:hypothetical protein
MKIRFSQYLGLGVASLCLASPAFGQTTLTLQSSLWPGNASTEVDSADAAPYQMALGSVGSSQTTTIAAICDDVLGDFAVNPTDILTTNLSSINGSTTSVYFQSDTGSEVYGGAGTPGATTADLTQTEQYVAAAYLAVQLSSINYGSTPADDTEREELSLAIWDMFAPTYGWLNAAISNAASYSASSTSPYTTSGVQSYVDAAIALAQTGETGAEFEAANDINVTILTPGSGGVAGAATGDQEFIYLSPLPEPSTWAFLGFDFASAGIAGLYFMRPKARVRS